MSERKDFLHDFVEKKLSTAMTKKIDNCTSRRSFLRKAKSEQNRIFKNCRQWIEEDVNFYVSHFLELFTYEKVRKHDDIFDFGRKTYIPLKISLGTVTSVVEYFIFPEVFVRNISKILRINYKEALEKVYGDIKDVTSYLLNLLRDILISNIIVPAPSNIYGYRQSV